MKIDLEPDRPQPPGGRKLPRSVEVAWKKSLPYFQATQGTIIHCVRRVHSYLIDGKLSHSVAQYLCGNSAVKGRFLDTPNGPLCTRCKEKLERKKTMTLPTSGRIEKCEHCGHEGLFPHQEYIPYGQGLAECVRVCPKCGRWGRETDWKNGPYPAIVECYRALQVVCLTKEHWDHLTANDPKLTEQITDAIDQAEQSAEVQKYRVEAGLVRTPANA